MNIKRKKMETVQPESSNYDKFWEEEWCDMKIYSPMAKHTRRWILKLLSRCGSFNSVCDVGCGEGSLLSQIKSLYSHISISGLDFSQSSVSRCIGQHPIGRFYIHDIQNPNSPFDTPADVTICSEVLEHVENDKLAIQNLVNWSKYLIVSVPGGELDKMAKDMGHLRHYSAETLESSFRKTALEIIETKEWGFPFAYPFYAKARNAAGYSTVTGSYSRSKKIFTSIISSVFYLNDFFNGGNKVFLLGRNAKNLNR